jgi:hypothetical protein
VKFLAQVLVCILFTSLCGCGPNKLELKTILESEKFEIHILDYHGSLGGFSSLSDSRKICIEKRTDKTTLEYYDYAYRMDETVTKTLTPNDLDFIGSWAYALLESHNSNKSYDGSCMGSNTDYELKNENLSVVIQAEGDGEFADYDLLRGLELY